MVGLPQMGKAHCYRSDKQKVITGGDGSCGPAGYRFGCPNGSQCMSRLEGDLNMGVEQTNADWCRQLVLNQLHVTGC